MGSVSQPSGSTLDLKGKTLILPVVSLANLPQLAVDLIINSLDLLRIGHVGHGETVVPMIGYGDDGELVTGGMELYGKDGLDYVVIQQRSPTLKSKKDEHVAVLADFIHSSGEGQVLILTSLDAAHQDDLQLQTPHQAVISPQVSDLPSSSALGRLKSSIPPLSLSIDSPEPLSAQSSRSKPPYPPFLPGSGLARRILNSLTQSFASSSSAAPHGVLAAWCVEGDNRADAHALAQVVLELIGQGKVVIKEPKSWQGLFGSTLGYNGGTGLDSELFG